MFVEEIKCQYCGCLNRSEQNYCGFCGKILKKSQNSDILDSDRLPEIYDKPIEECEILEEVGPQRIAKELLYLTKAQTQVLIVLFRISEAEKLYILDFKDLKAMVRYVLERREIYESIYGYMPESVLKRIIGAIADVELSRTHILSNRCNPLAKKFLQRNL